MSIRYHDAIVGVTLNGGKMVPDVYDYNSGYIASGVWHYENPTNTYVDIYRVVSGHSYYFCLGGTVGSRFRSMFTTTDVTQTTDTITGTEIKSLNNPSPYESAIFTASANGYILIAKDNVGVSGLKTYMYDRTTEWL